MCGAATPSSKAAWCSDKCREANRRRNQRQIRRDGGEYGTPRLEPEVVSERQKNNLASATARRVLRMWPIGECNLCNGPLQPWWIMYPSESPAPHCYVCDQELHKERYDKRNSVVKCLTCGEQFERTGSKRNFCSEDCKKLGRHDRNRRDRAKRLGASTGEPYSMRDVIEQSGGLCHLCGEPVDTELSGSDPDGPTIDHLTPLSLGGIDCRTNVALAHWLCNVKRGNKPLEVATWTTSVKN
jgi:predicted nucleic acid-binding Zn ribbon protein